MFTMYTVQYVLQCNLSGTTTLGKTTLFVKIILQFVKFFCTNVNISEETTCLERPLLYIKGGQSRQVSMYFDETRHGTYQSTHST